MYRESFDQTITSTPTVPLDPDTVYSVAITAGGICGNTTCSANCSTASLDSKNACSLFVMCVVVGMYVMLPTTEVDPEIKEGRGGAYWPGGNWCATRPTQLSVCVYSAQGM